MESSIKNILIADSHHLFRKALKTVLLRMENVNVIGELSNGRELLPFLKNNRVDIFFLDIEMQDLDGVEAAKIILKLFPKTKIVALTMFNDADYLIKIISTGVNYFLPKNADRKDIERAVNSVIDGRLYFPIHFNEIINNKKFNYMKTTKILIVDDDEDVLIVMKTILSKKGFNVVTAYSKEEGLLKIKEELPDIAILDVMMATHYEGFEMAKAINDDPLLNKIPILMQTSIEVLYTSSPYVQDMAREFRKKDSYKDLNVLLVKDIATGNTGIDYLSEEGKTIWFPVDGFIAKPFDINRFLPELERIIEKRTLKNC